MPSGIKKTHEEFVKELATITKTISVQGLYQRSKEPIKCRCLVCEYEWEPTPHALLRGAGCPSCAGNIKLTNEEFIEKLKAKNHKFNTFETLTPYRGMSEKINCKCKICDTIWRPRANDLIRNGTGCPSCSGKICFTHDRFIKDLSEKNPHYQDIEILSKYEGSLKRILCKCKKCNHEWNPIASSLIQGTGCPLCAKAECAERGREILRNLEKPKIASHDSFLEKYNKRSPHSDTIKITGIYHGANKSIECMCSRCGHKWSPTACMLLKGTGCPNCSHSSTSFMEQFLNYSFRKFFGKDMVINRDKELIGAEIDIFIPTRSFAVEIGSWKWHKDRFKNDIEKIKACNDHGVTLITIYDQCKDLVVENENVWVYPIDLGSEKQYDTLKVIFYKCLRQMGIRSEKFDDKDWFEIIDSAYQGAKRVTHDEFLLKLQEKNRNFDDIEILSRYTGAKRKIKCKCKKCKKEWAPAASGLLKGSGCPVCQIKAVGDRRSKKNQIIEWRKKHPDGSKLKCEKETGISRMTVYKWWNADTTLVTT